MTNRLVPELKEWQQRLPDTLYPFVYLDAIHDKVKEDRHFLYVSKEAYTILNLNIEVKKTLLDLCLSESEDANNWLSVLTGLHNGGVEDILITCVDGLTSFPEVRLSCCQQKSRRTGTGTHSGTAIPNHAAYLTEQMDSFIRSP